MDVYGMETGGSGVVGSCVPFGSRVFCLLAKRGGGSYGLVLEDYLVVVVVDVDSDEPRDVVLEHLLEMMGADEEDIARIRELLGVVEEAGYLGVRVLGRRERNA